MKRPEDQLIEIARRKQRLISRAEAQRATLADSFRDLRGPVRIADRGLEIARFLRAHPVIVGIAMATVMVFRGRSLASLAARGLALWRIWRSLSSWSAGPLI
jgi:hypothetical protein